MNRRVLIVSPHFPPVNAPDMQRARQALPHLSACGWDAEVLAVDPRAVDAPQDPLLAAALPPDIPVHRVAALSPRLGRWLGRGTLARRARGPLGGAGDELLAARRFDLVFFTTTQFSVLRLGPEWRRRHGVPFVLDWQDPWVTDFYSRPGAPPPPGGWRYRWSQAEARRHEDSCLAAAAGWVGTSEGYRRDLTARYAHFAQLPQAVIPFGFDETDFERASSLGAVPAFAPRVGERQIAFVGAAGPIMEPALTLLFETLRDAVGSAGSTPLHFHFIGTSYAPAGRAAPSVAPLAARYGLGGIVSEAPERIGYFSALATLRAADALLLLGSRDAAYQPSKIATLLHAGKPILAIAASDGLAETLGKFPGVTLARVGDPAAAAIIRRFCAEPPPVAETLPRMVAEFSAAARTRELAQLFQRALNFAAHRVD